MEIEIKGLRFFDCGVNARGEKITYSLNDLAYFVNRDGKVIWFASMKQAERGY